MRVSCLVATTKHLKKKGDSGKEEKQSLVPCSNTWASCGVFWLKDKWYSVPVAIIVHCCYKSRLACCNPCIFTTFLAYLLHPSNICHIPHIVDSRFWLKNKQCTFTPSYLSLLKIPDTRLSFSTVSISNTFLAYLPHSLHSSCIPYKCLQLFQFPLLHSYSPRLISYTTFTDLQCTFCRDGIFNQFGSLKTTRSQLERY